MDGETLSAWMAARGLPEAFRETVERAVAPLARRIAHEQPGHDRRPLVVGLCGSQGSGKSTIAALLARLLEARGLSTAVLSLDDLYLTREVRAELAHTVHPLLATRGPPGTHDVELGLQVLDALGREGEVKLPRFDKAADTRAPEAAWPAARAPLDVVLFEGWCVGARSQAVAELAAPINALEREDDPDGRWRSYVNAALAGDYQRLFARIDLLVLLQAPGFEQVLAWRTRQERQLAERLAREGGAGQAMDDAALQRFVMHYERLTRAILAEMPKRADVVIRLSADHEVCGVRGLSSRRAPRPPPITAKR